MLAAQWSQLQFDGAGKALNLVPQVIDRLRTFRERDLDASSILEGVFRPFKRVSEVVIAELDAIGAGGDTARPGARGVQPGGAIALGQAQDALGAAEAIEGPITEERVDEQRGSGTDDAWISCRVMAPITPPPSGRRRLAPRPGRP